MVAPYSMDINCTDINKHHYSTGTVDAHLQHELRRPTIKDAQRATTPPLALQIMYTHNAPLSEKLKEASNLRSMKFKVTESPRVCSFP